MMPSAGKTLNLVSEAIKWKKKIELDANDKLKRGTTTISCKVFIIPHSCCKDVDL